MRDIRYHPLVDCDSEGTEKIPMFPTGDEDTVRKICGIYLREVIPKYYRLCAVRSISDETAQSYTIHCPYCGRAMTQISPPGDNRRLGLYCCPDCK